MIRKFTLTTAIICLILTGCAKKGETLSLPKSTLQSSKYLIIWGVESESRPVTIAKQDIDKLNKIRFCSTGATTVLDYLVLEYEDGITKRIGFVNFGNKEEPFYKVAYQFDGLRGLDLRFPCTEKGHEEFVRIVKLFAREDL